MSLYNYLSLTRSSSSLVLFFPTNILCCLCQAMTALTKGITLSLHDSDFSIKWWILSCLLPALVSYSQLNNIQELLKLFTELLLDQDKERHTKGQCVLWLPKSPWKGSNSYFFRSSSNVTLRFGISSGTLACIAASTFVELGTSYLRIDSVQHVTIVKVCGCFGSSLLSKGAVAG